MERLIFEFKARLKNERHIRAALKELRARFIGTDHQMDTYFRVPFGRLKVREGRIENALISYERPNEPRARKSRVEILPLPRRNSLKAVLEAALGVLVVVKKRREIYFVGSVKIHLDRVPGLGKFVEVEAIKASHAPRPKSGAGDAPILKQARKFQNLFRIQDSEIVPESYSDLVLRKLRP